MRMFASVGWGDRAGLGIRRRTTVGSALTANRTSAVTAIVCSRRRRRRMSSRSHARSNLAFRLYRWSAMKNRVVALWITLREQRSREHDGDQDGK